MAKDTSISIRLVKEQEISSYLFKPQFRVLDELNYAKAERALGYEGREANHVAEDMERIILEAENVAKKESRL